MKNATRFTELERTLILVRDLNLKYKIWCRGKTAHAKVKFFLQEMLESEKHSLTVLQKAEYEFWNPYLKAHYDNEILVHKDRIETVETIIPVLTVNKNPFDINNYSPAKDHRFSIWLNRFNTEFISEKQFLETEIEECKSNIKMGHNTHSGYYSHELLHTLIIELNIHYANLSCALSFTKSGEALRIALSNEKSIIKNENKEEFNHFVDNKEKVIFEQKNAQENPKIVNPTFKQSERSKIFKKFKIFLNINDHEYFKKLLKTGENDKNPIKFDGRVYQLADAFKQLKDGEIITGCNKKELQKWITKNFMYKSGGTYKKLSFRYLTDIISSTKVIENSILDVTKQKGIIA